MGSNLQEWDFMVTDRTTTPGRAPVIDDDTGVVYALTVGTADSPTVYTSASGTTLTETHGVARMTLTNGRVRFWTDRTVTALDISWFGSKTAGYLRNVTPSQHELPSTPNGGIMTACIPIGNHAVSALSSVGAETPLSIFPASGIACIGVRGRCTSGGQTAASSFFDFGVEASATNGDANGFLASFSVSAAYQNVLSARGVLSQFTFNSAQGLSWTPSSATNSAFGALVFMQLDYGMGQ